MSFLFIKRKITKQATLFLIVTFFITILCYIIFLFLFKFFSIHYLFAVVISYISGIFLAFPFYEKHIFHSREELKKSFFVYCLINLFALILNLSFLYFIIEVFETNVPLTYLFVLAIITFIKFVGFKIMAFNNREW